MECLFILSSRGIPALSRLGSTQSAFGINIESDAGYWRSSATNRLITGKDHASVQVNIGKVDENGVLTGEFDTIALCGFVRRKGLGDDAFFRVAKAKGFFSPASTKQD